MIELTFTFVAVLCMFVPIYLALRGNVRRCPKTIHKCDPLVNSFESDLPENIESTVDYWRCPVCKQWWQVTRRPSNGEAKRIGRRRSMRRTR